MRILIRGGGFANKGAEALLKTVRQELGARGLAPTYAVTVEPGQRKTAQQAGFVQHRARTPLEFCLFHLGRCPMPINLCWELACRLQSHRQLDLLGGCTAVLDVSGFAYSDLFGLYPIQLTERIVAACHHIGVPYVFLPQAWGPFSRSTVREHIRHIAGQATAMYARDQMSYEYLRGIPAIETGGMAIAPDVVLKFMPQEVSGSLDPLERAGLLHKQRVRIGICPNIRIYDAEKRQGHGMANPYVQWLAELCRRLVTDEDVDIVLFPHEIDRKRWRLDDRHVCRLVYGAVRQYMRHSQHKRLRCFAEDCSADTLKLLVRGLDFLVSSRFHSIVAALSYHIPTVAIGWSHKYDELMNDAGVPEAVLSHQALKNDAAMGTILDMWNSRDKIQRSVAEHIPVLKSRVNEVFDQVAEVVRK